MSRSQSRPPRVNNQEIGHASFRNFDGTPESGPGKGNLDRRAINMAPSKKTETNRNNAKKSTGPKTKRGKANARWNALKHGAFATHRLIRGEDESAYEKLAARVNAEARPKTAIECMLVDQIVGDIWRLKRVEQAERAYLDQVRESALSRSVRKFSAAATRMVPTILIGSKESSLSEETLQAAIQVDNVMLDGMVSPQSTFPCSTLEQIRRGLVRDVLGKHASLDELHQCWLTNGRERLDSHKPQPVRSAIGGRRPI